MSSAHHARVKALFLEARAQSPADRGRFLAEACEGDIELKGEVESLLARAEDLVDSESELDTDVAPLSGPGGGGRAPQLANYRVLQRIGEGGMGEVYEAEQQQPVRRRVALKVLKGGLETKEVIARFESERQALAMMNHPNIARIFEAGVTERQMPYFAMELVHGEPVTGYCDRHRLTTRDRLLLFVDICAGVQHAHQKGIIHRDLKPSNVLVTLGEGQAVPKIIDFGVAKATAQPLTERTLFTGLGQWIGTPEYMSPEQAEMTGLDIDTRTDVYSLGVLLYELLVGARPFDSKTLREAGFDEMRRRIREVDPTHPSTKVSGLGPASDVAARNRQADIETLAQQLRGDLDWITMKALEKNRTRRYESPSELAADIERHLADEPVEASPPSTMYRLSKFVRRHRTAVAAGALVGLALIAGTAASTVGFLRARADARTARQISNFMVGMFHDLGPGGERRGASTPQEMLQAAVERIDSELEGQPLVEAQLVTAMGSTYRGLGMSDSAREQLERAQEIWDRELGVRGEGYATTIAILGDLLTQAGEFEQARALQEEALAIRRELLGSGSREVAWSLRSLAFLRWRQTDFEQARKLYDEALAITREGAHAPLDEATTLRLKALLEQEAGRYEVSKTLFRQSLGIFEEVSGLEHTEAGWCLVDFSLALNRAGDLEEALATSTRAIEVFERLYGESHPSLASPLNLNAVVLMNMGRTGESRSQLERSLALLEAAPEAERALVGWVLHELGLVASLTGRLEEARGFLERSLPLQEQTYGVDHPYVAFPLANLASVLSRGGDHEAARPLFERSAAIREAALGSEHPEMVWTLRPWAALLRRTGDLAAARAMLQRALAICEDSLGDAHVETARTLASLGTLEYTAGDMDAARALYQRVVEIREGAGADSPGLINAVYNLGCLAALTDDPVEAKALIRRAVDLGYAGSGIFSDPDLNSLRGDPEFELELARVRARRVETTGS